MQKMNSFTSASQSQRLQYFFECMNFRNIFVFNNFTPDLSFFMAKLPLNVTKSIRGRSLTGNQTKKIQKV